MVNIIKLRKKLKFLNYFSILNNNNVFFICSYGLDPAVSLLTKQNELKSQGFSFKFLDNKKITCFSFFSQKSFVFNGRILLIYKKDFDSSDNLSIRYILKNFSVLALSYSKVLYFKNQVCLLSNKKQKLEVKNFLVRSKLLVSAAFFQKLYFQVLNYERKLLEKIQK